jgi:hypothetical protein
MKKPYTKPKLSVKLNPRGGDFRDLVLTLDMILAYANKRLAKRMRGPLKRGAATGKAIANHK